LALKEFGGVQQHHDVAIGETVPENLLERFAGPHSVGVEEDVEATFVEQRVKLQGDLPRFDAAVADEEPPALPQEGQGLQDQTRDRLQLRILWPQLAAIDRREWLGNERRVVFESLDHGNDDGGQREKLVDRYGIGRALVRPPEIDADNGRFVIELAEACGIKKGDRGGEVDTEIREPFPQGVLQSVPASGCSWIKDDDLVFRFRSGHELNLSPEFEQV
jgi:hypothetical protein